MSIRTIATEKVGNCTLEEIEITERMLASRGWSASCDLCGEEVASMLHEDDARQAAIEHEREECGR